MRRLPYREYEYPDTGERRLDERVGRVRRNIDPTRASAAALALLCLIVGACEDRSSVGPKTQPREATAPRSRDSRTWALLINGGGRPKINYQSHLLHIRQLAELLIVNGIPKKRIVIFSSDGSDPEPDLAVRDMQPEEDFWLIEGLPIGNNLRTEIRYENSVIEDMEVRPATQAALRRWVEREGSRLEPGDTLLLYVTDHGTKNRDDLDNNAITLWGESLSVNELRHLIAQLPDELRVVSLMSQCFSGSFANAMYDLDEPDQASGNVCGYYSSSADRPAYGCYAVNRGKDNVGHSFRFFEAIRIHGNLADAHDRVLLTDRTPDVPNRTSDHYLEQLLRDEARQRGLELSDFVDDLLEQALRRELDYAPEFAQIDHIGRAFGSFSPRSLEELDERSRNFPRLGRELRSYARRWKTALGDLKRENLEKFFRVYPSWRDYLKPEIVRGLDREEKRRLSGLLLKDLVALTNLDLATRQRLDALRTIATEAETASYRMAVRRGAVLRMRSLLMRVAGLVYLDRHDEVSARAEFENLQACEDLSFGGKPVASRRERALPPPFPQLVDESELLANVLPGWIGIEFRPVQSVLRSEFGLERGAVRVKRAFPGSPAEQAGLRAGDIVLGPPGSPFVERNQIREWVMTSIVDEVRSLEVLRNGLPITVRVRVGAAPI
jgi:hypothetical protein